MKSARPDWLAVYGAAAMTGWAYDGWVGAVYGLLLGFGWWFGASLYQTVRFQWRARRRA